MRNTMLSLVLISLGLPASAALADTIYLKDGSTLKGKVASFANDRFILTLNAGAGRGEIFVGDIDRIEFDSAAGTGSLPGIVRDAAPVSGGRPSSSGDTTTTREAPPPEEPSRRDTTAAHKTAEGQKRSAASDTSSGPSKEPDAAQPEKPAASGAPAGDSSSTGAGLARSNGPIKTRTVNVIGKKDWTSTGLIIKRGDRIRITATGTVTLEPNSGLTSGPEGIDKADEDKLMPDRPTGALIAVIGADNNDFIFVGSSAELTAARDGMLFLSVNEGNLADNTGLYKAVIEIQSPR